LNADGLAAKDWYEEAINDGRINVSSSIRDIKDHKLKYDLLQATSTVGKRDSDGTLPINKR
jgi:hypothetical protein